MSEDLQSVHDAADRFVESVHAGMAGALWGGEETPGFDALDKGALGQILICVGSMDSDPAAVRIAWLTLNEVGAMTTWEKGLDCGNVRADAGDSCGCGARAAIHVAALHSFGYPGLGGTGCADRRLHGGMGCGIEARPRPGTLEIRPCERRAAVRGACGGNSLPLCKTEE